MVVPGRASGVKRWGWQRLGHQLVRIGWQSIRTVGAPAFVIYMLGEIGWHRDICSREWMDSG